MNKIKQLFNKYSYNRKITISIIMVALVLVLSVLIPTLANFMKEDAYLTTAVWNGSIASSYKSGNGSINEPYVISNGAELAYFSYKLAENDYADTYFELGNNIILNDGALRYSSDNGIEYLYNDSTYYIEYYTDRYYNNINKNGASVGSINIFENFNNFSGYLNGNNHTIFGLYMTDSNMEELAFFNNLNGDISNIFFKNTLIYGGINTSIIAINSLDTNLTNVIVDGYVVNKNDTIIKTESGNLEATEIFIENYEKVNYLNLNNIPNNISSLTLKGEIEGYIDDVNISINGEVITSESFSINLEKDIRDIEIRTSTIHAPLNITLKDLTYDITYDYSMVTGIIGTANNTNLTNVVNASTIYGNVNSSGLIGNASGKINITSSYNRGVINSEYLSTGLINKSSEELNINKSFNTGSINSLNGAGLVGNLTSATISNSFDISDKPILNYVEGSLSIDNSYTTSLSDEFINISKDELFNKEFLINNLGFKEFISDIDYNDTIDNIWYYEEYPYNYYDYSLTKVMRLHIGNLSFNNYNKYLETEIIKNNITFSVEEYNSLSTVQSLEYYIGNNIILSKEELNNIDTWIKYENINNITEEGSYIIYVKLTNYKGDISYINSNILILDLTGPNVSLNASDKEFNKFSDIPNEDYTNKELKFKINANDELSGIGYIKYLITDTVYSKEEINLLEEELWLDYNDEILLNKIGKSIIYAKVTDNSDNSTYLNTSNFNYQGYIVDSSFVGVSNNESYKDLGFHITDKSSLTINFKYEEEVNNKTLTNNLVSNIMLPDDTSIKLIDHVNSKIYNYDVINNEFDKELYYYPFNLFKEIGKEERVLYKDVNNYQDGVYKEDYTIIIDFNRSIFDNNYEDVIIYLESKDNDNLFRSTITKNLPKFNIYTGSNASIYLESNYENEVINLNTNSVTEIDLTSGINYKRNNEYKILDTTYEHTYLSLNIKLVDEFNNVVDKKYLKNILVNVDDKNYFIDNDNIIRIPGNSFNEESKKTLKIITYEASSDLPEGTYYMKITSNKSFEGYFSTDISISDITIPVSVSNVNYNKTASFAINMNKSVINKITKEDEMTFDLSLYGDLIDYDVKVALYEKEDLTGYNQKYKLVNINDYITDNLINDIVNINEDLQFKLNFKTDKLKHTGYSIVFEMYNGETEVDRIKKYFIVR